MRIILFLFALLLIKPAVGFSQSETYDLVSFVSPAGWTRESNESKLSFSITSQGLWCRISIYKSIDSNGGVAEDFRSDWKELVVKPLMVAEQPVPIQLPAPTGWERQSGGGVWESKGTPATVILSTVTAYGKSVSFVAITNSKKYGAVITSFLSNVKLNRPAQPAVPLRNSRSLVATWQKITGDLINYKKEQYTFLFNGSYEFYSKEVKASDTAIYLIRETGVWQARGNTLVLDPAKCNLELWSRKNGTDHYGDNVNSRPLTLERARYQMAQEQIDKKWTLQLKSNSRPQRDGAYSHGNVWIYMLINDNLIDLPN